MVGQGRGDARAGVIHGATLRDLRETRESVLPGRVGDMSPYNSTWFRGNYDLSSRVAKWRPFGTYKMATVGFNEKTTCIFSEIYKYNFWIVFHCKMHCLEFSRLDVAGLSSCWVFSMALVFSASIIQEST